jgi:LPS export ABC transporter protein LptC
MMKKAKKKVIIALALMLVLSLAALLTIGIRKGPENTLLKIMSDRVDIQVRNARYTEVGDSGMKWEITADTARYQKKDNLAFFDKLTARMVMKDGRTFLLTGDRGRFNTDSRDMEIEGNVSISSENGDSFTTDRLRYRNVDKQIDTDREVVMKNKSMRVSGVGMIFSLSGKKVTILSQVRASSMGE